MTPGSMLIGLLAALLVPLAVGGAGRWIKIRRPSVDSSGHDSTALPAWAMAGGFVVAVSLLLAGSSRVHLRWLAPREALDWLPILALLLAVLSSAQRYPQLSKYAWTGGIVVCLGAAFRLLYGSVFLRPSQWNILALVAITLWGAMIATSWALSMPGNQPAPTRRSWIHLALLSACLAWVAVANGMSGSFTYGAVSGIVAVSTVSTILITGQVPGAGPALAMSMLGLGHAFAELPLTAAVAIGLAQLGLLVSSRVTGKLTRWSILGLSILLMLVSGNMVTRQFLSTLTAKPETNGYEVYK